MHSAAAQDSQIYQYQENGKAQESRTVYIYLPIIYMSLPSIVPHTCGHDNRSFT